MNDSIVSQKHEIPNIDFDLEFTVDGRISRSVKKKLVSHGFSYCARCKSVKPIGEFRNRTIPWCVSCIRDNARTRDNSQITIKRQNRKLKALDLAGGRFCIRCGFDEVVEALEFHHLDPTRKDFIVAGYLGTQSKFDSVIDEIRKCVVLCANCHRGVHAGVYDLPPVQMYLI